jgi:hypothetical protein
VTTDAPALHLGAVSIDCDISVADLDGAADRAMSVGARLAEHQPAPELWRVFLDPAGHPFCLTTFGA